MRFTVSWLARGALRSFAILAASIAMISAAAAQTFPALANAGGATVSYSGNTMTILLNGANRIVEFNSFDLGSAGSSIETINVLGTQSVLFRVTGPFFSDIYGYIQAPDASVYLSSPNGVLFEGTSSANIGGTFQVTTAGFNTAQQTAFLNGTLTDVSSLSPSSSSVINVINGGGTIVAAGDIALQADTIYLGSHTITSTGGDVRLLGDVVPEPGAWAMMIGGFVLVGAALRRRKRRPVPAFA